jgi:exopolyphosphatase / guanosine-5'-triphosphate,3'-diphosphate pyrophosphatase
MPVRHDGLVRVGVVDVGGNTARLLVASASHGGLKCVAEDRVPLRLGAEIEHTGTISAEKLGETAATVARFLDCAADTGCAETEVLVTSPGRQSRNRVALECSLESVAPGRVRFVSALEEGSLAYTGAFAGTTASGVVAVCDVGGGSTEIAIGTQPTQPLSVRSIDLGSLRVARRYFRHAPPTKREVRDARKGARAEIEKLAPQGPPPTEALATGGTARALRKIVGHRLGRAELVEALAIVTGTKPRKVAERYDLPTWRAESLVGGVILLGELQRHLGPPLVVSSGGLREGAALEMLRRVALAA